MTIPAWLPLLLAIPVLLMGEFLLKRVKILSRYNIPAPVIGGLIISLAVLAGNLSGVLALKFDLDTAARWWTWLVTPEVEWRHAPSKLVQQPFLIGFFACIGLNASWSLAKRGGPQVVIFLLAAAGLAVIQNGIGVGLSHLLGVSPLLGLICGSVSMTGGHATALGFAPDLEKAGLSSAAVTGMAAATFGLVSGGLLGGPVGGSLIRRFGLRSETRQDGPPGIGTTDPTGIWCDLRTLVGYGKSFVRHLLLLLLCIKLGAWVSYFLQASGLTFPVTMGAMLVGVTLRNAFDLAKPDWIQTHVIESLASVTLGVFLSTAMMSLNLIELVAVAAPMLIILCTQILVVALFAWFATFRVMGRDFDAAVMAAGHCGFGLGATPTAVANMKALVEGFGPASRAFLVVPIVGAFLIDFLNALNITSFLNLVK